MEYQGFCMKCKKTMAMKDAVQVTMKGNRKAVKGKCISCNTTVFKILKRGDKNGC